MDLLFPRRCPLCDRVQPLGEIVCPQCAKALKRVQSPFCRKCGKARADAREEYCGDCSRQKHLYTAGRALWEYPDVRRSVYRFKYGGRKEYGEFYGRELAEHLGKTILSWKPDVLVPVPLHGSRKRMRGYNQAEVLARETGKRLDIRVDTHLITRARKTMPQKMLSPAMRQNNLKRAFKIVKNVVELNTIIIVDDIYTTGSTVDAMTAVLREAGIKHVYFITLAIGKG